MFEPQWLKLAERGRWLRHSPGLVRYVLQGLHQESFFFTLPFFLATTTWASAQPVFLVALAGFALVSMIDPLYFDRVVIHRGLLRSEEHTSELQSLMRISYAVFCLKKKTTR